VLRSYGWILFDVLNEEKDTVQIENENSVIGCQSYSQDVEYHEVGRFHDL
jgi:hypothetical protein